MLAWLICHVPSKIWRCLKQWVYWSIKLSTVYIRGQEPMLYGMDLAYELVSSSPSGAWLKKWSLPTMSLNVGRGMAELPAQAHNCLPKHRSPCHWAGGSTMPCPVHAKWGRRLCHWSQDPLRPIPGAWQLGRSVAMWLNYLWISEPLNKVADPWPTQIPCCLWEQLARMT